MPVVDQIDCPYCDTKKSGFEVKGFFRRLSSSRHDINRGQLSTYEDWLLMSCGTCRKTISGVYTFSHYGKTFDTANWLTRHGDPKSHGFVYKEHHPNFGGKDIPLYVPDKVAIPYKQALSNLAASNFDAAGTMARKTLEIASKDTVRKKYEKTEEIEKLINRTWLKKRLEALQKDGHLTKELSDLAQIIKGEGDGAAHDEEPYIEKNARQLIEYAEALLTYIYSVPGMLDEVRKQSQIGDETAELSDKADSA